MNGIVHNCTHGDSPAMDLKQAAALPKPLTEAEVFSKVMATECGEVCAALMCARAYACCVFRFSSTSINCFIW